MSGRNLRLAIAAVLVCGCSLSQHGAGETDGSAVRRDGGASSPHAVRVVSFEPGPNAGHGQDRMPQIVLGPPRGAGETSGSLHVVSLGVGGSIVLELGTPVVDGPGVDLLVFENAFRSGRIRFVEPGIVSVGPEPESLSEFPCEAGQAPEYPGCAGTEPVHANAEQAEIDPTEPDRAGGDGFDLADLGVPRARFVRIEDAGAERGMGGDTAGFDLDAVAVIHGAAPSR